MTYQSRDTPPLLLANIGQLLTLRSVTNSGPRRGRELLELGMIEDGAVLCIAGKIVSVGRTQDALRDPWIKNHRKKIFEIDCARKVVLPGFVDSHTHPAFVSPRLVDFEKRIAGATYEEIAQAGGGIRSSVDGVRKAGKSQLSDRVLAALNEVGADLGDPIEVSRAGGEILVTGVGIAPRRQQEIAAAIGPQAHVVVRFSEPPPAAVQPEREGQPAATADIQQLLFSATHNCSRTTPAVNDQDHTIHHRRQDRRVGKRDGRR